MLGGILNLIRKRRDDAPDEQSYGDCPFIPFAAGLPFPRGTEAGGLVTEFDLPPHLYREITPDIEDDGDITLWGLTSFHSTTNSSGRQ